MARYPDIVIFGAGIAGLWVFHRLKKLGYDVLLLEKEAIGNGQTIASQGILHSGLKFSLAGKINKLADTISKMPERWHQAIDGKGEVDLSATVINTQSQQLLIPSGFMGPMTKLVVQKALGSSVNETSDKNIMAAGFKGSSVSMNERVLDIPSALQALSEPYKNCIKKVSGDCASFLKQHDIRPKWIVFTCAGENHKIAQKNRHDEGLEIQKRPLLQGIIKNVPFPLYAHFVGKTDKPVASITTHKMQNGTSVWYIGGGVAERSKEDSPNKMHNAMIDVFQRYLPNLDLSALEWATLPIDRVEGKSKTDSWMPDTPTIHKVDNMLYCWPTKLTFAPLLSDMILKNIDIEPSKVESDFSDLQNVDYAQTPWDNAQWRK